MSDDLPLHPAVAALAASLTTSDGALAIPDDALSAVQAALRVEPDLVTTHLLAWTLKVSRTVGFEAAEPVRVAVLNLLRARVDADAATRDSWEQDLGAAKRIGSTPLRAPAPQALSPPAAPAKPMRGLKR